MYLSEIKIENFRCFENIDITFDSQMNVIVGNNGMGKSSLLDAVKIGIGSFFLGIESVKATSINKKDVRFVTCEVNNSLDRQPQFPVSISCTGFFNGNTLKWSRQLKTESGSTTYGEAVSIKNAAKSIQNAIRHGDNNIDLPLLSHYGTDRLVEESRKSDINSAFTNRFQGYTSKLSSKIDKGQMLSWLKKMTFQELQDGKQIPELKAVQQAMAECFKDSCYTADDVKVRFGIKSDEIEISYIDSDGKKIIQLFSELSDGFRSALSLTADIAYRMAILNPQYLEDVTKKTEGIVLIDEIDQHLHPRWQRNIISSLMSIFPKVQFIVTTHSPNVIASVKRGKIIMLNRNEWYCYDNIYGKDTNSVLSEVMDVKSRPDEVADLFSEFYDYLNDENYIKAEECLNKLAEIIGESDSEYVSVRVALDFEKAADEF